MRIIRQIGLVLSVGSMAVVMSAQTRPNFSGKWTLERPAPSGALVVSSQLIVKHDGKTLWEGQTEGGHHSSTYTIDGKSHENMIGPVKSVSKAEWDGDRLVLHRTSTFPSGASRTTKQVWSLEASGKLAIVLTDQRPGQDPQTMTNVYVKK